MEADDKGSGGDLAKEKQAKELAAQNFINEDRALMRFEFLEAMVSALLTRFPPFPSSVVALIGEHFLLLLLLLLLLLFCFFFFFFFFFFFTLEVTCS